MQVGGGGTRSPVVMDGRGDGGSLIGGAAWAFSPPQPTAAQPHVECEIGPWPPFLPRLGVSFDVHVVRIVLARSYSV